MQIFLYQIMPMIVAVILGQVIYLKADKKYNLTKKVDLKLKMKQQWKAPFCVACILMLLLILGVIGSVHQTLYSSLSGFITGAGTVICNKLAKRKI